MKRFCLLFFITNILILTPISRADDRLNALRNEIITQSQGQAESILNLLSLYRKGETNEAIDLAEYMLDSHVISLSNEIKNPRTPDYIKIKAHKILKGIKNYRAMFVRSQSELKAQENEPDEIKKERLLASDILANLD